jgi:hypothetical protein
VPVLDELAGRTTDTGDYIYLEETGARAAKAGVRAGQPRI